MNSTAEIRIKFKSGYAESNCGDMFSFLFSQSTPEGFHRLSLSFIFSLSPHRVTTCHSNIHIPGSQTSKYEKSFSGALSVDIRPLCVEESDITWSQAESQTPADWTLTRVLICWYVIGLFFKGVERCNFINYRHWNKVFSVSVQSYRQ